jgi:hypothetical protein
MDIQGLTDAGMAAPLNGQGWSGAFWLFRSLSQLNLLWTL